MNFLQKAWHGLLTKAVEKTAFSLQEEIFYRKYPKLYRLLSGGEPSWTGKTISEHGALNIGTVWACTRNISATISGLPLHIIQVTPSGKRVASEHPLDWVLYGECNEEMSARALREAMTAHCVTWGNAFAQKVKRGGTGQTIGLWLWTPDSVTMDRTRDGRLVYIHQESTNVAKTYERGDVFHLPGLGFDGRLGYSVISMARQTLGLASVQDEYVAKFFASGGRRPYLLNKKIPFQTDQKYQEFRDKWEAAYNGADNFHKAPLLEGDIELKELGMPFGDAQMLDSRKHGVAEICRWFRQFPYQVGHMDQLTFNNVEHLSLQAVQYSYSDWINRWETEINRQLLTPGEKGRYYAKHNLNALLRGDFKTRMEGYSIGLQNGFVNRDEVRDLEDWNAIPNGAGQSYTIQLNMQTLPGTGEPTTAERAALAKISLQQQQQGDRPNANAA